MNNIQWYPGHMVKTKKEIISNLKLVDIVIELLDARIPTSSKNPIIDELIQNKPKLVILNKCDLANPEATKRWIEYYKENGITAIAVDSTTGRNFNKILDTIKYILRDKIARNKERGIVGKPIRGMVVGIPNVGKSSFINRISSRSSAKTGDKPGVTRSKQWIKIKNDFELLDTPGILWPKFEDEIVSLHLAYTRAIKDEILNIEEIAVRFISELKAIKPSAIEERYKIELVDEAYENLIQIGRKRGCIVSGGEVDTEKAAIIVLDDYRSGRLGNLTLDFPNM